MPEPSDLPDFGSSASAIRNYESQYIPGLLQTERYIHLLLSIGGTDPEETARRTAPRIERQNILTREDEPCTFHAVVEEGALQRIADAEVRQEQVRHLIDMAQRSNLTIQVIPVSAGLYAGAGEAFMYLSFPRGPISRRRLPGDQARRPLSGGIRRDGGLSTRIR